MAFLIYINHFMHSVDMHTGQKSTLVFYVPFKSQGNLYRSVLPQTEVTACDKMSNLLITWQPQTSLPAGVQGLEWPLLLNGMLLLRLIQIYFFT